MSAARHCQASGFSLIESMVALGILGVLAALAAPDFSQSLRRARIASVRDEFTAALNLARGESIVRRSQILLVRNASCDVALQDSSDWSCGMRVVADLNGDAQADADEPTLQATTGTDGVAVAAYLNNARGLGPVLTINRWGQIAPGSASFVFYAIAPGIADESTNTACLGMEGMRKFVKASTSCGS